MSRQKKKRKSKAKPFNGSQITSVFIDEADSLQPGLWADPEPKHTKPPVEPEEPTIRLKGFEYAKGGLLSIDSLAIDNLRSAFAGISDSAKLTAETFQKIGRINRNPGLVMVDSEAEISQETMARIMGKRSETPITVNIQNNLCKEVELPPKALSVDEHRDFIRKMLLTSINSQTKTMYYGKAPAPEEKESFIPKITVQVEGRKEIDRSGDDSSGNV